MWVKPVDYFTQKYEVVYKRSDASTRMVLIYGHKSFMLNPHKTFMLAGFYQLFFAKNPKKNTVNGVLYFCHYYLLCH